MTGLLAKDLRLSLDTLRPWALTVVGALVGLLLLRSLPSSVLPAALIERDLADLLALLALTVGLSGSLVAAWSAARIIQGDQIHGAELLAASMPVSAGRRAGAKAMALVAVVLAPGLAGLLLFGISEALKPWVDPAPFAWAWFAASFVAISAIGAGLALPVAVVVRGPSTVVFLAILSGTANAIGAAAGAWIVAARFETTVIAALSGLVGAVDLKAAADRSQWVAIWVALGLVSIGGLAIGLVSVERASARRWVVRVLVVSPVLATVVGGVTGRIALAIDEEFRQSATGSLLRATRMDDAAIADAIGEWASARRRARAPLYGDLWFLAWEGARRLALLPPEEQENSPVLHALLAAQDYDTVELAEESIFLLPQGGPHRRDAALAGMVAFPRSLELRRDLSLQLQFTSGAPRPPAELWGGLVSQPDDPEVRGALARVLLQQLEWLASEHPDIEPDAVERAIELLRSEAP